MNGSSQADSAAQVSAPLTDEEKAAAKAAKAVRKAEKAARKAEQAEAIRVIREEHAREDAKYERRKYMAIAAVVVWQVAGTLLGFDTPLDVAEDFAYGFVDSVFNGEPCETKFCV